MNKTKIEWCDYTINPVKGLCPMACPYCYARAMYKRFKWNPEIRFEPEWAVPIKLNRYNPSRIFVGSTIELFGDWVKDEWMREIFEFTQWYPENTFIFLTKQPQNLIKFSPFPDNCWVGVSATSMILASAACAWLSRIEAKVKYLSIEPLLEWEGRLSDGRLGWQGNYHDINWVIIGQQTPIKTTTTPKLAWVQEILSAADKANIPVFLKDNLDALMPKYNPSEKLRQEWPVLGELK